MATFDNEALATCVPALEQLGTMGTSPLQLEAVVDAVITRAKLLGRDKFGGTGLPDERVIGEWYVFGDLVLLMDPSTGHGPLATHSDQFSLVKPLDGCWILLAVTDQRLLAYVQATQKTAFYPHALAISWSFDDVNTVSIPTSSRSKRVGIWSDRMSTLSIETAKRPVAGGKMKNLGVPNELAAFATQVAQAAARSRLDRATEPAERARLEQVLRGEYRTEDDGELLAWLTDPDAVPDAKDG